MAELKCLRCGETKTALERPPYPDALGRRIAEKICADCWEEAKRMQVMVINEYRLDLSDPRAQEILERSTRDFLGLAEDGDEEA
ncbi:MAG: Fe(2+)-trafficking protein [Gemmatimonadota bacterium]